MKFLCVYFWFFPYRSLREQDFLAISKTLAAQMTQNPDAYDSGRLELFKRSYTGQISGDRYFGLVNSIRDGSMSAFGTFPFGMLRSLIPRLAKFHMVFQINEFVDLKPGGP
jgi:hypothetical protein